MTYSEFYKIFEEYFTKEQISAIQKEAFLHYEDAHGHKPTGKSQRQIAYSFMFDMLYNMEIQECIDYFESLFRKPHYITAEFWDSLEYCQPQNQCQQMERKIYHEKYGIRKLFEPEDDK